MKKKAVMLLAGGLDSTTVLAIAHQQGFELHTLSFVPYGAVAIVFSFFCPYDSSVYAIALSNSTKEECQCIKIDPDGHC